MSGARPDRRARESSGRAWWSSWWPVLLSPLAAIVLGFLVVMGDSYLGLRPALAIASFPFASLASSAEARRVIEVGPGLLVLVLMGQYPLYALAIRASVRSRRTRAGLGAMAAVHLLAVFLSGPISWGPSFETFRRMLRQAAGPGAGDCGLVRNGEPHRKTFACARCRLARKEPFYLVFQVLGVDSQIFLGLAYDPSREPILATWDSDGSGGSNPTPVRGVWRRPCPEPSFLEEDGRPDIDCLAGPARSSPDAAPSPPTDAPSTAARPRRRPAAP